MRRPSTAKVRFKNMPCRKCGDMVRVGSNARKPPLCIPCAAKAVKDNAEQMQSRSGPNYEKWRAGMLRSIGE